VVTKGPHPIISRIPPEWTLNLFDTNGEADPLRIKVTKHTTVGVIQAALRANWKGGGLAAGERQGLPHLIADGVEYSDPAALKTINFFMCRVGCSWV